jgi:hypothetical protein
MDRDRHIWRVWVAAIHRWGLQDWIASILEAFGPLTILGAQMVYLGQPLFNRVLPEGHYEAVARLLEDPFSTRVFVAMLREAHLQ